MCILLDHGSFVQRDKVCGVMIATYTYKHNELHLCVKVKRAISESISEFASLLLVIKLHILNHAPIFLDFRNLKKSFLQPDQRVLSLASGTL